MATVNKDFKVKNGLIVEGTTATVNNYDILTKKTDDQNYIIGLIGGTATSTNTANAVVKRDASGNFAAGTITADITGTVSSLSNHDTDDLAEGTNLYYTDSRARGAVSGGTGLDYNSTTGVFDIDSTVTTNTGTQTLENKTISYTNNTITVQVANVSDLTASAAELNTLDGITASTAELNKLDGVTATTAELNILDGVTADYSEINILDGATLTTAELNYVAGVTSSIQTQLNDKAPLASPALTGTPTAPTASAGNNSTQIATTAYVETAVANLVDGAPALLNTLNELAEAISDDANFATTLTTSVGTKVSKAGDTMTGLLVLSADPSANLGAATKQYVDAAQSAAENYADGLATNYEVSGAVSTHAGLTSTHGVTGDIVGTTDSQTLTNKTISGSSNTLSNIGNASLTNDSITVNGYSTALGSSVTLDTDDVAEGTNLYYTDARAKAEAATLLANATKTNIVITKDGSNNLTITAENGVADSTTSDLAEGSNLYFTNARAVTALEAVVPNFTAVELNSIAKQVAATASIATASTNTAVSWLKAEYRSAEFLVKIANGSHTDVSKVILTLDTSDNVAITEYAMVGTNGNLGNVSADVSGNDVRLRVETLNNTSTVAVIGTLLA